MNKLFNMARNIVITVIFITVVAYIGILRYQNKSYENTITRLSVIKGNWHKIEIRAGRIDTIYKNKSIKRNTPLEGGITIENLIRRDTIILKDTFIVIPQEKVALNGRTYGLTARIFTQVGYSYPNGKISPQVGLKLLYWHDFNFGVIICMEGYGISAGWHIYHQPLEIGVYSYKEWIKNKYNFGVGIKVDIWNLSR